MKITPLQMYQKLEAYFELKPDLKHELKNIDWTSKKIVYWGKNAELMRTLIPYELLEIVREYEKRSF